jgi:hypothetical protein
MNCGAAVVLLAGNHDLRLLLGLQILGRPRDPRFEHFFVRMGPKAIPLLKEVHDKYLQGKRSLHGLPSEGECRRRLYPSQHWQRDFPKLAEWVMPDQGVDRELERMRKKMRQFGPSCAEVGLSMRQVYGAALKLKEMFLKPAGDYHWFFDGMQLAHREGSFLFVHAGLDDRIAAMFEQKGLSFINRLYLDQLQLDPFEFYYGPVANALRTKYRKTEMPLTSHGVNRMSRMGIHAVVHGHRNSTTGQRIMLRHSMLHFECDLTLDRHSRKSEGLSGHGAGVTIIRPQGQVVGISTDYAEVKVFDPGHQGLAEPR